MTKFSFCRKDRYPALDFEIDLLPTGGIKNQAARARLLAVGDPTARQPFDEDFLAWSERHNITATGPEYMGVRSGRASCYEFDLANWTIITDFMIVWVGIATLSEAIEDVSDIRRELGGKVQALGLDVQELTRTMARLEFFVTPRLRAPST